MGHNVHFLHIVRCPWKLQLNHVIFVGCDQACPACPNNKEQGAFCCMQLQIRGNYSTVMQFQLGIMWHAQSSPRKQIANISRESLVILLLFCMLLFADCQISTEARKICDFGMGMSGMGSQPIRLPDILNLKNSKTIQSFTLIFCIWLDSY